MSAPGSQPTTTKVRSPQPRRGGKGGARQPNRAQLRAMEARAAATTTAPPAVRPADAGATDVDLDERRSSRPRDRTQRRTQPRAVARPIALTREEEYRFIRSDLNRLLVTAGALLAFMIVLLVVIEP